MAWTKQGLKRSYPCNAEVLLYLRERRGWTQTELAKASGFSERLICKAEAGKPILTKTLDAIAGALSTPEKAVYPEDLICDPLKLAKEYIAALYQEPKDFVDSIRHFLDEDFVLRIGGDPAIFPFAGEHRGIAAVERAFEIFFSILEAPKNHDYEPGYTYLAKGNEVIVWGECWIHPIGAPMERPLQVTNRMKFRRGKMVLIDDRFDTLAGIQELEKSQAARAKVAFMDLPLRSQ